MYQLRVDAFTGSAWFERVALPFAGGVYEQPAREMEALAVLESVATEVLHEQMKESRGRATQDAKAKAIRSGIRHRNQLPIG